MSERLQRIAKEYAEEVGKPQQMTNPDARVIMDEPIFPDGPLKSQVESWKRQFGEVYVTAFDDEVYVWRTLNRYEYKVVTAQPHTDGLMREEMLVEHAVLWPQNFTYEKQAQTKAGSISVLAEQIMEMSNFTRSALPQRL